MCANGPGAGEGWVSKQRLKRPSSLCLLTLKPGPGRRHVLEDVLGRRFLGSLHGVPFLFGINAVGEESHVPQRFSCVLDAMKPWGEGPEAHIDPVLRISWIVLDAIGSW